MGILENRLKKIESAQSKTSGFWVLPFPRFYGRSCKPVWQEKPGSLSDFYASGTGYCEGCNETFCKMDAE